MTLEDHEQSGRARIDALNSQHGRGRWLYALTGIALVLAASSTSALAGVAVLGGSQPGRSGLVHQGPIQLVQSQQSGRAREQAQIGRLEEEIRRLNGRIEELEFNQRQTNQRLDRMADELAQRSADPDGGDQITGDPVIVDQQALSPEQAINDLLGEPEEGSLGRVPESAIAGLPRPNPADVAAPTKNTLTAEQQYENAVKLLQAGNYQGAQSGLELFLDMHEDHQLASNAAYWLAETQYVRQNYAAAAAAFARNYRNYGKDSPKAVDNLLKLGMSLSNLGEADKACLTYDELNSAFPSPPAQIEQAVNRERARAECG